MGYLSREEVALRIFCVMLQNGSKVSVGELLGENEVRVAFKLAETFERVSSDVGGRPVRQTMRRGQFDEDD